MDKIYSRFRIPRIVGINNKPNNKRKFLIIIILVILMAYTTAIKIIDVINPMLESYARISARATSTTLANDAVNSSMQDYTYNDLCQVEKDEEGNIKLLKLNVINVNKISTNIALQVQEKLNDSLKSTFNIRLGTLTANRFFAGKGPVIEIKMETVGDIQTNIKSEFTSAGINQTLHRIYIDIVCDINILTPYKDTNENINMKVLLAEAVIVGNIPETYYDLDGLNPSDSLNMIG